MASTSIFGSSSSERRWISQISKIMEKEVMVEIDYPVSIFRVPATLSVFKPEAYVPQLIGLGPYHHLRPELYELERYKLAAAGRLQHQFKTLEFKELVNKLKVFEHRVRACYHKYLDMEGETLAWIMAIDGLFLLEFLRCYNQSSSITTAYLVDSTGRKLAHGSLLSDMLMLENQIPIFILSKILSIQCSSHLDVADNTFPSMLMNFCKALSPLKIQEDPALSEVSEHAHLLDLLYYLIVPELEVLRETDVMYGEREAASFGENAGIDSSKFSQVFEKLWNLLSNLEVRVSSKITTVVSKIIGVSRNFVTHIPVVSIAASKNKEDIKPENEISSEHKKTPVVDEIMIPSVLDLSKVGVEFCPTSGGITTIKFDPDTKKFYLPVVTLNVNSEVVMRNLVAYESSIASESLVFTRYTELMNGIIDTAEDAKLLREKKIIVNSLKSDADVAQVFNGMSKSIRLTNVPFIAMTIQDVNKYFSNTRVIRVYRRMQNFVYGSWKILTVLAVVLHMLLMGVQLFCSVYSCHKLFNTINMKHAFRVLCVPLHSQTNDMVKIS